MQIIDTHIIIYFQSHFYANDKIIFCGGELWPSQTSLNLFYAELLLKQGKYVNIFVEFEQMNRAKSPAKAPPKPFEISTSNS